MHILKIKDNKEIQLSYQGEEKMLELCLRRAQLVPLQWRARLVPLQRGARLVPLLLRAFLEPLRLLLNELALLVLLGN